MLPVRLLPRSRTGRILLRTSVLTLAVLFLAFIAVAAIVQSSVRHVIAQQEAIRRTELARALVLRLQIDEETALRGFTITGDRSFLAPFAQARPLIVRAFDDFDADLRVVAPSLVQPEREQRRINEEWTARVALPSIRAGSSRGRLALELRGKAMMDRSRALSAQMADALNAIADAEDRSASEAAERILVMSVVFGGVLAAALVFYAAVQARLGHALSAQEDENERLTRVAATLQQAFLVEPLPRVGSLSFDAVYAPAAEEAQIGGDWYGIFDLPDGRIYFSMGDVAGHGIGASVLMERIRQTILSIAMHESDPSVILARANEVLRLRTDTMVTALCGFIDAKNLDVVYASAGHPPPLIVTADGDARFLPTSGAPLGVTPDPGAVTYSYRAPAGAMLVCYTDGIVEFDHNILRGERRLCDVASAVKQGAAERPAAAILRRALGAAVQRDDIAVLTIEFAASASARLDPDASAMLGAWSIERGDVQSARAARGAFLETLKERCKVDALASETIFGELVANALEHGAGPIEARLYASQRGPLLVVQDTGGGIPQEAREHAHVTPPLMAPRGRGLHIVRALARDLHIGEQPHCSVFVLLPEERASA